jgi:hypothetical protein
LSSSTARSCHFSDPAPSLTGLTSRTGGATYDVRLGQQRADRVKSYLFRQLTDTFKALPIDAVSAGKNMATGRSDRDGTEDRSVIVEVFLFPAPPSPPPIPMPPLPRKIPPVPDYIKKGSGSPGMDIPMFQVPNGKRLIATNTDNTLSFSAGTIVDCVVMGVGAAHVTIVEGRTKVTVQPTLAGASEEFDKFGKLPMSWKFDFKVSSEFFPRASVATVICFSDWIPGMAEF